MSNERSRENGRLDYKLLSKTGRRVQLMNVNENKRLERITESFKSLSVLTTNKLVDDEKKVCLKIDRFIDEYEFKLLFDIEDIEAGIAELKKLQGNSSRIKKRVRRRVRR